jgi:hypothetical protein
MYSTYTGQDLEELLNRSEIVTKALRKGHSLVHCFLDGGFDVHIVDFRPLLCDAPKVLDELKEATRQIEGFKNTEMVLKLERAQHSVETNLMLLRSQLEKIEVERNVLDRVAIYLRQEAGDVAADSGCTLGAAKTDKAEEPESRFRSWYTGRRWERLTTNLGAQDRFDGQQCALDSTQAAYLPDPVLSFLPGSDTLKTQLVQTCNIASSFQTLHQKSAEILEEVVETLGHLGSEPLADLSLHEKMLCGCVRSMQDAQRTCFEVLPRIVLGLKALRGDIKQVDLR